MNKTNIVSITIMVAAVLGLIVWSKTMDTEKTGLNESNKSHPARIAGALVPLETFYDFGTISMKNGNVSKTFTVSNTSEQDINLEKLTTSCMCTVAYILKQDGNKKGPFGMPGHGRVVSKANEIIKAGEERNIEVVFDPNAHGPAGVGLIERLVFLEDENKNIVEFKFKAIVTP